MYAQFEIRQHDLSAARKALGTAIGLSFILISFFFY